MDGWIYLGHGVYVKPIDWEEIYAITSSRDGMQFVLWKRSINNTDSARLIGTAPTPAAAARLVTT